jgi:hypothetical protein
VFLLLAAARRCVKRKIPAKEAGKLADQTAKGVRNGLHILAYSQHRRATIVPAALQQRFERENILSRKPPLLNWGGGFLHLRRPRRIASARQGSLCGESVGVEVPPDAIRGNNRRRAIWFRALANSPTLNADERTRPKTAAGRPELQEKSRAFPLLQHRRKCSRSLMRSTTHFAPPAPHQDLFIEASPERRPQARCGFDRFYR